MNKKLLNTCVQCTSEKQGEEILNFYSTNGFEIENITGLFVSCFYGVDKSGVFFCKTNVETRIIYTLDQLKELVKETEKPYPKWMKVSDNPITRKNKPLIRKVEFERFGKFHAWIGKNEKEIEENAETTSWEYAIDTEGPSETELKIEKLKAKIEKLKKKLEELKLK